MSEFLAEHSIEILAIVAALLIFFWQQRKKILTYFIITKIQVISVSRGFQEKIKVLYNDEPINNVFLFEVMVINSGIIPIRPSDYIEPICLSFNQNAKVISAEVSEQSEGSLGIDINTENPSHSTILITNKLLNPKDFFVVKAVVGESDGEFSIKARIAGLKKIKQYPLYKYAKLIFFAFFLLALLVFGIIIVFPKLSTDDKFVLFIIWFFLLIILSNLVYNKITPPIKRSQ